jgi:hypothetical protein
MPGITWVLKNGSRLKAARNLGMLSEKPRIHCS